MLVLIDGHYHLPGGELQADLKITCSLQEEMLLSWRNRRRRSLGNQYR
jgi:hypothetical protein